MNCIFLYNLVSGKGIIKLYIDAIEEKLKTKYDEVVMYPTKSVEDAVNTAKNACGKYHSLIFAGGDGTFNNIVCSVAEMDNIPTLGYIPCGTANDIARNLKIPRTITRAVKNILNGYSIPHDIGKVNDRYFMYVCGCGMFTGLSYRTQQNSKRVLGRLAYVLDGIPEITNPTVVKAEIEYDGKKVYVEGPLLLILNSRSVGGVPFNKRGHLNDGYFDIIINKKKATYVGSVVRLMLAGTKKHRDNTKIYSLYRAKKIKIKLKDNLTWCLDGEEGMKGDIEIENLHNHIRIFVPQKHHKPKTKHLLGEEE